VVSPIATAFSVTMRHASSSAGIPPLASFIVRHTTTQLDSIENIKT
jgi:hypothetical protein